MRPAPDEPAGGRADLRLPVLGAAAWAGALVGFRVPLSGHLCLVVVLSAGVGLRRLRRELPRWVAGCLLVGVAAALMAGLRAEERRDSALAGLAGQHAYVSVRLVAAGDPVLREGRFADYVVLAATARTVEAGGLNKLVIWTRTPVLVVGPPDWAEVPLGAELVAGGRLAPAEGDDYAAVLSVRRPPVVERAPGAMLSAAAAVRQRVRAAAAGADPEAAALVPALVVGDDAGLSAETVADFRVAGLTHLTAVSGTNLTLAVGFLLLVARWAGVRAHGLTLVGGLGVAGFVLVARPEPSVLRAAAMGVVVLAGMGSGGRGRGIRALGAACGTLVLLDPWLARSWGFALSAVATLGILVMGPALSGALARWLPRWLADAVAVPLAAQLACTPLVAALSGQVSLVAVLANLLAAPVVGPVTVLGMAGGLLGLVSPGLGAVPGRAAGWCAQWLLVVAHRCAELPGAAVDWSTSGPWLAVLAALSLVGFAGAPRLLARPLPAAVVLLAGGLLVWRPLPTPGWPPEGWVMVACDVGQGDALVLAAGRHRAVVVDTGPDPVLLDRCLDRLRVDEVPVVVLTHFHADHVGGLAGVLTGRRVGEVQVTATRDPVDGASEVDQLAAAAGVPVRVPAYGEARSVGGLTWQVLGPARVRSSADHGEEGSVANNSSLVLLVTVAGQRILLTGDMEPEAQRLLAGSVGVLKVDVLKVPHHGSRFQLEPLLASLGARLAVISVGADNDYGHPAAGTLAILEAAGMEVRRTDRDGDVAVVVGPDGRLRVSTRR